MTEAQKELYTKTKERFRRMGKENPADVILGLAEEVEYYRSKIQGMEEERNKKPLLHTTEETLWQLNLDALKRGAFGNLVATKTGAFENLSIYQTFVRYWEAQKAAGYPYAEDNVRYFQEVLENTKKAMEMYAALIGEEEKADG